MRRGKRTALVSLAAAVVVIAAISGASQSAGANRLDGKLRTNQVQVLATHNSYHIQQERRSGHRRRRSTRTRRSTSSSTGAFGDSRSTS